MQPAVLMVPLSIDELGDDLPPLPVAYEDFHPGRSISVTPGSEGQVGNIIRDRVGERFTPGAEWIHPTATLDELRDEKVRSIVLVTDNIGSGTQVRNYIRSLLRNRRLRSWVSFGWVRIHVVAYAATEQLEISPFGTVRAALHVVRHVPTVFTAGWTDRDREEVLRLCKRHRFSGKGLGFGQSGWLFVSTRVPNTVPDVLRKQIEGWNPLFLDRQVPADLLEVETAPKQFAFATIAVAINQARLLRTLPQHTGQVSRLLVILSAFTRRRPNVIELAIRMGLRPSQVRETVASLQSLGLLSIDGRVTSDGSAFLAAGKKRRRVLTAKDG